MGLRQYSVSDHLGNMLATVLDRKSGHGSGAYYDYWLADVSSATDYYPFGMPMQERMASPERYRLGYDGQQKSDEVYGKGNLNTALFWEYDTRLGRRWNMDPVDQISISNYSVMRLNPILLSDPLGDCVICPSHFDGVSWLGDPQSTEGAELQDVVVRSSRYSSSVGVHSDINATGGLFGGSGSMSLFEAVEYQRKTLESEVESNTVSTFTLSRLQSRYQGEMRRQAVDVTLGGATVALTTAPVLIAVGFEVGPSLLASYLSNPAAWHIGLAETLGGVAGGVASPNLGAELGIIEHQAAQTVTNISGESLGAGRAAAKRWLQKVGTLSKSDLISDIENAGFKKVFDAKGMMHFDRGGMKIRLDPPQKGTPFNHLHLNYGGNRSTYDIYLNPVDYRSPAAHIRIQ